MLCAERRGKSLLHRRRKRARFEQQEKVVRRERGAGSMSRSCEFASTAPRNRPSPPSESSGMQRFKFYALSSPIPCRHLRFDTAVFLFARNPSYRCKQHLLSLPLPLALLRVLAETFASDQPSWISSPTSCATLSQSKCTCVTSGQLVPLSPASPFKPISPSILPPKRRSSLAVSK